MKKTSLTSTLIESLLSRSNLFNDLKRQNDANVESIDHLLIALENLSGALEELNFIVKQHDQILNDLLSSFSSTTELPPELMLPKIKDDDKGTLN